MTSKEIRSLKPGTLLYARHLGLYYYDPKRLSGRGLKTFYKLDGLFNVRIDGIRLATIADIEEREKEAIDYLSAQLSKYAEYRTAVKGNK